MKKAIVLLLALAIVGGAVFAQSKANVYIEGELQLWNLDVMANHAYSYAAATFSGSNDTAAYSMTLEGNMFDGSGTNNLLSKVIRDWNVNYKLFDNAILVSTGKLRNATYRMGDVYGAWVFTDRILGYGLLTEIKSIENLSIGINLPIPTTNEALVDVLQKTDLGVTYKIDGVGNLIALVNLDLVNSSNILNFGFNVTAIDKLALRILYKGTFAATTTNMFNLSASYPVMDALKVGAVFTGTLTDALVWNARLRGDYTIDPKLAARAYVQYNSDATYDAYAQLTYALGGGLSTTVRAGYNGAAYAKQTVFYAVSF
jgi:hypothetical protein